MTVETPHQQKSLQLEIIISPGHVLYLGPSPDNPVVVHVTTDALAILDGNETKGWIKLFVPKDKLTLYMSAPASLLNRLKDTSLRLTTGVSSVRDSLAMAGAIEVALDHSIRS